MGCGINGGIKWNVTFDGVPKPPLMRPVNASFPDDVTSHGDNRTRLEIIDVLFPILKYDFCSDGQSMIIPKVL